MLKPAADYQIVPPQGSGGRGNVAEGVGRYVDPNVTAWEIVQDLVIELVFIIGSVAKLIGYLWTGHLFNQKYKSLVLDHFYGAVSQQF